MDINELAIDSNDLNASGVDPACENSSDKLTKTCDAHDVALFKKNLNHKISLEQPTWNAEDLNESDILSKLKENVENPKDSLGKHGKGVIDETKSAPTQLNDKSEIENFLKGKDHTLTSIKSEVHEQTSSHKMGAKSYVTKEVVLGDLKSVSTQHEDKVGGKEKNSIQSNVTKETVLGDLKSDAKNKVFVDRMNENSHPQILTFSEGSSEKSDHPLINSKPATDALVSVSSNTLNPFNMVSQVNTEVKEVYSSHSAFVSQQIKDQIIDRILVSTNDLNTGKQVKIVFNPTLLEATEVNFKQEGRLLNIDFFSKSSQSLQFLQNNQLDLQAYLQDNLKQFKNVAVSVTSEEEVSQNPRDGRSKNRQEYQNLDDDEQ